MPDGRRSVRGKCVRKMRDGAILVVLGLLGVSSAVASQITIGPSLQNVFIDPAGAGKVNVTFGLCAVPLSCTLTGPALFQNNTVGGYNLTIGYLNAPNTTPFGPNGGVDNYKAAKNWAISTAAFPGIGLVVPMVNYQFLYGASPNVQFTGSDGPLPGDYFDFSLHKLTCVKVAAANCNVQTLAGLIPGGGAYAYATISSGEFVFVPEPTAILLIGAGFGVLGLLRTRQLR